MKFLQLFCLAILLFDFCDSLTSSKCDIYNDSRDSVKVLLYTFGPFDEYFQFEGELDGDRFAEHMCKVAETSSIDEYFAVVAPNNDDWSRSFAQTRYNNLVAQIAADGGMESSKLVAEDLVDIVKTSIAHGFPELPLKADPKAIKDYLQPFIDQYSPHFVSSIFFAGEELDPYFETESNVDAFSKAITEVSNIEELSARLGWTSPNAVRDVFDTLERNVYDLEYLYTWVNSAVKVIEVLYDHGILSFNHVGHYPLQGHVKGCNQLGQLFYENMEDISYIGSKVFYNAPTQKLFLYTMAEYFKLDDVFSQKDWEILGCWAAEKKTFQEIHDGMGLPPDINQFVYSHLKETMQAMGGLEALKKMATVAEILLPVMKKAGYPGPFQISYDEALSTLERLIEAVGPYFPNYLDPSTWRPEKLGAIGENLGKAARAISDSSSIQEIEEKMNIPTRSLQNALAVYRDVLSMEWDLKRAIRTLGVGMDILEVMEQLGLLDLASLQE